MQFGKSRKDILQQQLSKILNTSLENVDVFTVMSSPVNSSFLDVRFSAHGSPYYAPERLENKITEYQTKVSSEFSYSWKSSNQKILVIPQLSKHLSIPKNSVEKNLTKIFLPKNTLPKLYFQIVYIKL